MEDARKAFQAQARKVEMSEGQNLRWGSDPKQEVGGGGETRYEWL